MTVFLITVLSLLVLCLGASFYLFRFACARRTKISSVWDDDKMFAKISKRYDGHEDAMRTCEALRHTAKTCGKRLSITSHDGLRLSAMLIPQSDESTPPVGVLAMFHGYRSNPILDFGPFAEEARNSGFVLLMADQRAHGGSDGKYITYGVHERHDAAAWCRLLAEEYPTLPIVLYGLSMGATTVMLASALRLPENVRAVVADCGYTSPAAICAKVLKSDLKLPRFPIYYGASMFARIIAHFSFNGASAVEAAGKSDLPLLIIHGEDDKFVPYEMGVQNRNAAGDRCLFLSVPEAGHGKSYLCDPDGYMKAFRRLAEKAGIKIYK